MTLDVTDDFGRFDGRVWLNAAHQGPLPHAAAAEALEAIDWKMSPRQLTEERFREVPDRLKTALAYALGAPPEEIVLGNSASYGLHLLANGIAWKAGDEVLVVRGDFPVDILPWLGLEDQGVQVRCLEPANHLPTADELCSSISPATRLFCSTWVHSFSGVTADLAGLGEVCRAHEVLFVANVSQGLGAQPLVVSTLPVDAVVGVGFKWLCGPYGTGFLWLRLDLLEELRYNQAYWLAEASAATLSDETADAPRRTGRPPKARTYDVFGTANFFNFKPWAASLEYLMEIGLERIAAHDQELVTRLIEEIDRHKYVLVSPEEGPQRSTLVFLSHRDPARNPQVHAYLEEQGIDVVLRRGNLRLSPHLYNTREEIDQVVAALDAF